MAGSGARATPPGERAEPPGLGVVLFEQPNFGGQSLTLAIGHHPLTGAADLEKMVSSVLVPAGLVAMLHDEADASGGRGEDGDPLEAHGGLAPPRFYDQTAYVAAFSAAPSTAARRPRTTPPPATVRPRLPTAAH